MDEQIITVNRHDEPDFSNAKIVELEQYMLLLLRQYDREKPHVYADALLCELIKRLVDGVISSDMDKHRVLRIVDLFNDDDFTKWYS